MILDTIAHVCDFADEETIINLLLVDTANAKNFSELSSDTTRRVLLSRRNYHTFNYKSYTKNDILFKTDEYAKHLMSTQNISVITYIVNNLFYASAYNIFLVFSIQYGHYELFMALLATPQVEKLLGASIKSTYVNQQSMNCTFRNSSFYKIVTEKYANSSQYYIQMPINDTLKMIRHNCCFVDIMTEYTFRYMCHLGNSTHLKSVLNYIRRLPHYKSIINESIYFACMTDEFQVTKILMKYSNANPIICAPTVNNSITKQSTNFHHYSNSGFIAACANGNIEIVKLLITSEYFTKSMAFDKNYIFTESLKFAIHNNHIEIVNYLMLLL